MNLKGHVPILNNLSLFLSFCTTVGLIVEESLNLLLRKRYQDVISINTYRCVSLFQSPSFHNNKISISLHFAM
ncbi:hypothetical protein PRUPE_1G372400 [Prunus persica]|uniref:Uncharacterized protein n=1 Tax=Prunus persica TaxID=3760 RepID=A0A251R938_PRUPE|nr:hypothetical protein PRUPE_1G372400 [Prunus persica]